jgi:Lon protease-like protein
VQALHVFEPRYLQLLEDALAGDQLIAMALLQPGWEVDYDGRPAIFPMVCVGRVLAHARLESGRYNIMLQGTRRAALVREFPPDLPFRLAEVAILEDLYPAGGAKRRRQRQQVLLDTFRRLALPSSAVHAQIDELTSKHVPLGKLLDVMSYALPLKPVSKQRLLAEWNVDARSDLLLEQMQTLLEGASTDGRFPPGFSDN